MDKHYQLFDYCSSLSSQCYAYQETTKCGGFEYLQESYTGLEKTREEPLKDFTVKSNEAELAVLAFMEYEHMNTMLKTILNHVLSIQHRTEGVSSSQLVRKFKLLESENARCNAYNSQCEVNNLAERHSLVEEFPNDEIHVCIDSSFTISLQSEIKAEGVCVCINEHSHNDPESVIEVNKRQTEYTKTVSKSDRVEKLSPPYNAGAIYNMSMQEYAMWHIPKVKCTHTTSNQAAAISSVDSFAKSSYDNNLTESTKQCYDNPIAFPAPSLYGKHVVDHELSQPVACTDQVTCNGCTLPCCSPGMPSAQYTEHETCKLSLPSTGIVPSDCTSEVLQTHEVMTHCDDQKLAQTNEQHLHVVDRRLISVGPTYDCRDFFNYLASCGRLMLFPSNSAMTASSVCMDTKVCSPDLASQVAEKISFSPVLLSKVYSLIYQAPSISELTADFAVERNPFFPLATFQWLANKHDHFIKTCKHLSFECQNASVQCPLNHPVLPCSTMQPQVEGCSLVPFSSDVNTSTGTAHKNSDFLSTVSGRFLPIIPSRKASSLGNRVHQPSGSFLSISVFQQQFKTCHYILACTTTTNSRISIFAGLFEHDVLQWMYEYPHSRSCMSFSEPPIQPPKQLSPGGAMPLVPHRLVADDQGSSQEGTHSLSVTDRPPFAFLDENSHNSLSANKDCPPSRKDSTLSCDSQLMEVISSSLLHAEANTSADTKVIQNPSCTSAADSSACSETMVRKLSPPTSVVNNQPLMLPYDIRGNDSQQFSEGRQNQNQSYSESQSGHNNCSSGNSDDKSDHRKYSLVHQAPSISELTADFAVERNPFSSLATFQWLANKHGHFIETCKRLWFEWQNASIQCPLNRPVPPCCTMQPHIDGCNLLPFCSDQEVDTFSLGGQLTSMGMACKNSESDFLGTLSGKFLPIIPSRKASSLANRVYQPSSSFVSISVFQQQFKTCHYILACTTITNSCIFAGLFEHVALQWMHEFPYSRSCTSFSEPPIQPSRQLSPGGAMSLVPYKLVADDKRSSQEGTHSLNVTDRPPFAFLGTIHENSHSPLSANKDCPPSRKDSTLSCDSQLMEVISSSSPLHAEANTLADIKVLQNPLCTLAADSLVSGKACACSETTVRKLSPVVNSQALMLPCDIRGNKGHSSEIPQQSSEGHQNQNYQNGHNNSSNGDQGSSGVHGSHSSQSASSDHQRDGTNAGGGNGQGDDDDDDDKARKKKSHLNIKISWHVLKRHSFMLPCLLFYIIGLFCSVYTSCIDKHAQPSSSISLPEYFKCSTSTHHRESEVPIHGCMDEFTQLSFQQHYDYSTSTDCQESKVQVHSYISEFAQPSLLQPLNYTGTCNTDYQGNEVQIYCRSVLLVVTALFLLSGLNTYSSGNQDRSGDHGNHSSQSTSDDKSGHQRNGHNTGGGNERDDDDNKAQKKKSHLSTSWHILKRHLIMLLRLLFYVSFLFHSVTDELAQPSSSLLLHGYMDEFIQLSFRKYFDYTSTSTDCQECQVQVYSYINEFARPSALLQTLNYSIRTYTGYHGSKMHIHCTSLPLVLSLMFTCALALYKMRKSFPKLRFFVPGDIYNHGDIRSLYLFLSLPIMLQYTGISILPFFIMMVTTLFLLCIFSRDRHESSFDPGGSNCEQSLPRKGAFSKDGTHDLEQADVNLLLDNEGSEMVAIHYSFTQDLCSSMRCGNAKVCQVSNPSFSNSTLVMLDRRTFLQKCRPPMFALPSTMLTAADFQPTSMLQTVKPFNETVDYNTMPLVQDSQPAQSKAMKKTESIILYSSPVLSSSPSSYLEHFKSLVDDSSYLPKAPHPDEQCQEVHDDFVHSAIVSNGTVHPLTSYLRKLGQMGRHNIDSGSVPSYEHNFISPREEQYQREEDMNQNFASQEVQDHRILNIDDTPAAAYTNNTIGPLHNVSPRSKRNPLIQKRSCFRVFIVSFLLLSFVTPCEQAQAINEVSRPDIPLMFNNASSAAAYENFVSDIAVDNVTCTTIALHGPAGAPTVRSLNDTPILIALIGIIITIIILLVLFRNKLVRYLLDDVPPNDPPDENEPLRRPIQVEGPFIYNGGPHPHQEYNIRLPNSRNGVTGSAGVLVEHYHVMDPGNEAEQHPSPADAVCK
jgi:hypothetical protein